MASSYMAFPPSGGPEQIGQPQQYGSYQPPGAPYAAVYSPTNAQVMASPQGQPLPGSPTPGARAFMNLRMQDGTMSYVPVVATNVGGRLQWMAAGANGQPQAVGPAGPAAGAPAQPTYGDIYRNATAAEEKSPSAGSKWYTSSKKEKETKASKKLKEWEREQRAREEAEAKQRAEYEARMRPASGGYAEARRLSVSNTGGRPSGILHHSTSSVDLDQRFNSMQLGQYTSATGIPTPGNQRARRVSVSESGDGFPGRSRRPSMNGGMLMGPDGPTGGDYGRSRKISGSYGSATPGSAVGAFYPDRERALGHARGQSDFDGSTKSPGYPMTANQLPPGSYVATDGSGRVIGPGGPVVLQQQGQFPPGTQFPGMPGGQIPGQMPGQIPGQMPGQIPGQPPSMFPPRAPGPDASHGPPPSFYRPPNQAVPYSRFEAFPILWDLNDLRKFSPPLPALLVPCDVTHDDWNRCMQDIIAAWSGQMPYDIFSHGRPKRQMTGAATPASMSRALVRPSSAVTKTLDIWNASFFLARKLEVILYRGLERRSGMTAGKRSERLKKESIPPQYREAIFGRNYRRRRHRRDHDDDEDDSDDDSDSSLTSSSTSDESGSEVFYSDEESEEEPAYVSRERRAVATHQIPQTPYPASRSRRSSIAAPGTLVSGDAGEMWVVKSREAARMIKQRQKIERKRRKLERRQRRRELRGEPLYSLWIAFTR